MIVSGRSALITVSAGFCSRLHRNHICRGSDCWARAISNGAGPGLAGYHDRDQPADFVPHATFWFRAVLSSRRGSAVDYDRPDLPWRNAVRGNTATRALAVSRIPGAGYLVAR